MSDSNNLFDEKEKFEKNLNSLCVAIESNSVIPIVGFDLYQYSLEEDHTDLLNILHKTYSRAFDEVWDNNKNKSIFNIMNGIFHRLPSDEKDDFGASLSGRIQEMRANLGFIPKPFEQLAKIKQFRFYVNATFFKLLEIAVNRNKDLRNEKAKCKIFSYNTLTGNQDIEYDNTISRFSTKNFKEPAIYNWLGTHSLDNEYVISDVQHIDLLAAMISNKNNQYANLELALKGAKLLFIGCDFPDWILRFFLKFCKGNLNKAELEKSFIIEQFEDESSKAFFIDNYGIKKFSVKPDEFVDKLFNQLKSRNPDSIEKSLSKNHVFISYNHDDFQIAKQINEQLKNNLIDTWFDETGLMNGDDLDDNIKNAIDNAFAFIPIVTNHANEEPQMRKYYKREWNYAVKPDKYNLIFPIRINDYNGNTIFSDVFTKEVKDLLLKDDGSNLSQREVVNPDNNYLFKEDFINKLKKLQYKQRTSG